MAKSFQCSVITPEGSIYDGPADFVAIPAIDGELGILHDRAPLLAKLGAGRLRVVVGTQELLWFIDGGFAQVLENHTIVLTQRALKPTEIDVDQARVSLEQARHTKATDDLALKRKSETEASARAQLRMAAK
jgi:F-type H+-transporting ATPase subunit epsilon